MAEIPGIDYVKQYRDLYAPKAKPQLIDVPKMQFLAVDGAGAPEDAAYQEAVSALYAIIYTIKMSYKGDEPIEGYTPFKVPPLEGLWTLGPGGLADRTGWRWSSLLRVPEFVTPAVLEWARGKAHVKRPELNLEPIRLEDFTEGLCVQMMHVGPYSAEPQTLDKIEQYIQENGLINEADKNGRRHHELYLGDPRRTAPERLKTVLRLPVAKA